MTRPTISASISTDEKPKIPTGIKLMLSSFGIDAGKIQDIFNSLLDSGALESILSAAENFQRVEKKLDSIIQHFNITVE